MADAGGERMRAVRFHEYGDASVLQVEDAPRPTPREGEVLVRVRAAGVNAVDWKTRAGYLKEYMPLQMPHVLGYDLAGTVEATGPGVQGFSPGDDVFGRGAGTYAEYATAPANALAKKPANLSFEQAAVISVCGVSAWLGLFEVGGLQQGQRLLVQGGAGGVGGFAVQLGRWKGAAVTATSSTGNVEYVRSLGAGEVIDYTTTDVATATRDVDVVLDTVGGAAADALWPVLRRGGILVTIAGMPDPERAAAHGVRTSGVMSTSPPGPVLEELLRLIASGDVVPQLDQVFAFTDAAGAHARMETGHGRGRVALRISG